MSASPRRFGSFSAIVLSMTLASCQGATAVCDPDDVLCNGGGGGQPSLTIGDATVTEGHEGTVSAVFPVTLSRSSTQTVTVSYATSDGTATAPEDYTSGAGQLTLSAGTTSAEITIEVVGDLADEGASEAFSVTLSSPSNASLADGSATGTITDDDDCEPLGPMALGTFANGTLGPGDCQIIVDLFVDIWDLSISSQSTVQIDLVSNEFDAYLELEDDQFSLIADDDDGGADLNSRIVTDLEPGNYRILASSYDVGETGSYALTVGTPSPVISNLSVTLVEISSPECVSVNGGSLFDYSIDYTDANADVTLAGSSFVDLSWVFQPSGSSGSFPPPGIVFVGGPDSGTVFWSICTVYGTDTSQDVSVTLTDDAGQTSLPLRTTVAKPAGAPTGATPSSLQPEGVRFR